MNSNFSFNEFRSLGREERNDERFSVDRVKKI